MRTVVERVAAERAAQGLPEHVEDESVLDTVAAWLAAADEGGDDALVAS
jgi:hypothetical protein